MLCALHNWLLIHYDSLHDFAAPVATILAAFAAVSVTGYFAWRQAFLAREKLRLDLYNRRFETFSSLFDFYNAMIYWKGTPEQTAARTKFFRACQECGFCLSRSSTSKP